MKKKEGGKRKGERVASFYLKKTEGGKRKGERVAAACDNDEEQTMTSRVVASFQTSRLKIKKLHHKKKLGFLFPNFV